MKCPYCLYLMRESRGTAVGWVCQTIGCLGRGVVLTEAAIMREGRRMHEALIEAAKGRKS